MIPLSRIQVCHSSQAVTQVRTLLATQSCPDPLATSSGLYPYHQIAENKELPSMSKRSITKGKGLIKQMCINVETKHIIVVVYVNNLGLRVHSEVP